MLLNETRRRLADIIESEKLKHELLVHCFCIINQSKSNKKLIAEFFAKKMIGSLRDPTTDDQCRQELEEFFYQTLIQQHHSLKDFERLASRLGAGKRTLPSIFGDWIYSAQSELNEAGWSKAQLAEIQKPIDHNCEAMQKWIRTHKLEPYKDDLITIHSAKFILIGAFFLAMATFENQNQPILNCVVYSSIAAIIFTLAFIAIRTGSVVTKKFNIVYSFIQVELPDPAIPQSAKQTRVTLENPSQDMSSRAEICPLLTNHAHYFVIKLAEDESQNNLQQQTQEDIQQKRQHGRVTDRGPKRSKRATASESAMNEAANAMAVPVFPLFSGVDTIYFVQLTGMRAGLSAASLLWGIWNTPAIREKVSSLDEKNYQHLLSVFQKGHLVGPTGQTGIKLMRNIGFWEVKIASQPYRAVGYNECLSASGEEKAIIFSEYLAKGLH